MQDGKQGGEQTHFQIGGLLLDPGQRTLSRDGTALAIGARAFDLLHVLARAHPAPVASEVLVQRVWGDTPVDANNLRVQVAGLRKRLGAGLIRHERLRGYWLGVEVRRPSAPGAAPPEPLPASPPGNLPEHPVVLTGRAHELARLHALLREPGARVTLSGAPGIGKTSLALAAAQQLPEPPADGVWLVELSPLQPGAEVCATAATTLALPAAAAASPQHFARALAGRALLLVLDNGEHVQPAVQALCDALLREAPRVTVLCTSRRALKCAGEQLLPLAPLAVPAEDTLDAARDSAAVALFEERARRADPRFVLTPGNAAALCRIGRLLDGVPLAIGFAAARVSLWGVEALSQRLADPAATPGLPGPPAAADGLRHTSAAETIRWSHALLGAPGQALMAVLGAFAGSVPLGALQQLAATAGIAPQAVLPALADLLDNSLLTADAATLLGGGTRPPGAAAPEPRYTMHALVRDFAHQQLQARPDAAALHQAHARWCRTLIPDSEPGEKRRPKLEMPPLADVDNLRKAIRWAAAHELPLAMDLCARMAPFWRARGMYREGIEAIEPLLLPPPSASPALLRARLRIRLCSLLFETGQLDRLLSTAQTAVDEAMAGGSEGEAANAWGWTGLAHNSLGALPEAVAALQQNVELARRAGDDGHQALGLANLGLMRINQGRFEQAEEELQAAIALAQRADDAFTLGASHENLGELALKRGRPGDGLAHAQAAMAAYRRLDIKYRMANVALLQAQSQLELGALGAACTSLLEMLHMASRHGFDRLIGEALVCLAGVHLAQGQTQRARALLRMGDQLLEAANLGLLGKLAESAALWRQTLEATALPAPALPSVAQALQWAAELGQALAAGHAAPLPAGGDGRPGPQAGV